MRPASVQLDVPFFANDGDGNQCLLVCARTAIYRHTGKDISLSELDDLSGRPANGWTYTQQMVLPLLEEGCRVEYYSITPIEKFLAGEEFFSRHYGELWQTIAPKVNLPAILRATEAVIDKHCFTQRKFSEDDFCQALAAGYTVIVNIDYNTLMGNQGKYGGHSVVLTGYTPSEFIYHENGPKNPRPHVHVDRALFLEAWNHAATDNDVVLVTGPAPHKSG